MTIFWRARVLCFYGAVSVLTIIFCILFFMMAKIFNLSYHIKYQFAKIYSQLFIWFGKIICGLKYNVTGLSKLPVGPCVVLANHQSFWDNVFMQIIIPKHSWIIKRELFNVPFFGWGLKMVDPIAVDRTDNLSVKQILREGKKKLQDGVWLVVFPESTRLRPSQNAKFKPSAVKLAVEEKVPIVLIAHNAGVYWPKGFWISKPGTIHVNIIDVIEKDKVEESEIRELTTEIENIINTEKQVLLELALAI